MKTKGVLVPIVTPFTSNNQVDLKALEKLTEHFIQSGVAGIVACGTTGEYYALSEDERLQVLETIARVAKGKVSIIAGANGMSTQAAIERAQQAKELGYEGLMLAGPSYSLPGQEELKAHFKSVAESTDLPIILYNFPDRVGVEISIESIIELSQISNIVGIKESSGDFSRALALIHLNLENFEVICGCDDQAADFLFWGVQSWISGGANVFPAEQAKMLDLAEKGDWDQVKKIMVKMLPVIQAMESGDYNQKAKIGCSRHNIEVGSVRQPLLPISENDASEFKNLLRAFN